MRTIIPLYRWILLVAIIIMTTSLFITNRLTKHTAQQEKEKMKTWAEATQNILNEEYSDFVFSIIEGNENIPVIVVDEDYNYISSRNIKEPTKNIEAFYQKKIAKLRKKHTPIEISLGEGDKQYILYDDSYHLKWLSYYPIVQWGVILLFILIIIWVFNTNREAEQNRLWVGLTKETAHQLGTPISSLTAWNEILKLKYPQDETFDETQKDIERLKMVTERFSKIGSKPELIPTSLTQEIQKTISYMQKRTSSKISYSFTDNSNGELANINPALFNWVIENLFKNAIDAIQQSGKIDVVLSTQKEFHQIDVTDSGCGMDRKTANKIFEAGFTTKKRGWGLGLSLSRRIIEQYHRGKITVSNSVIGVGTTFTILIPRN